LAKTCQICCKSFQFNYADELKYTFWYYNVISNLCAWDFVTLILNTFGNSVSFRLEMIEGILYYKTNLRNFSESHLFLIYIIVLKLNKFRISQIHIRKCMPFKGYTKMLKLTDWGRMLVFVCSYFILSAIKTVTLLFNCWKNTCASLLDIYTYKVSLFIVNAKLVLLSTCSMLNLFPLQLLLSL
jgi:hypothetical protein